MSPGDDRGRPGEKAASNVINSDVHTVPDVTPLRVRQTRGRRLVVVTCPFCCGKHVHGWPAGDVQPGLRTTHCGGRMHVYRIAVSA